MGNDEAIKASASIHISHKLSLIQQQLWNFLLSRAYNDLLTKREHYVPIALLRNYLDNTRNNKHIAREISKLNVQVHFNIFDKDKKIRGIFGIIRSAYIKNKICYYSYSPRSKELLLGLHEYINITKFLVE